MLPGLHVIWKPIDGKRRTIMVPPAAFSVVGPCGKQYGLKWFWLQMLQGDAADNIPGLEHYGTTNSRGEPGLKRMGEKTAEKFLEDCSSSEEAYRVIRELYRGYYEPRLDAPAGSWADRFCEQAALLWLRTDGKATVTDFATHKGYSCISKPFCTETKAAVKRLDERVKAARAEIDGFSKAV